MRLAPSSTTTLTRLEEAGRGTWPGAWPGGRLPAAAVGVLCPEEEPGLEEPEEGGGRSGVYHDRMPGGHGQGPSCSNRWYKKARPLCNHCW